MEEHGNMTYNFVICGSKGYYLFGYHDIMNLSNVRYFTSYTDGVKSLLTKKFIRFTFSNKVNSVVNTPLSSYVFPRVFPHDFNPELPLCYLFFSNNVNVIRKSYLDYLRSRNPKVKIVLYYQDLVKTTPDLDINLCKDMFDLVLSYDKGDCDKYGLHYHPTPLSYVEVKKNSSLEQSDIYFCGKAKTRYPIVNKLYKQYSALGLKCDFHLMEYPAKAERIDGIHYDEPMFSYEENIQHILNTRCVLEIMQEGADGFTPRQWEAIIYNRHLLTNNAFFSKSSHYNSLNMHSVSENNILDWIKSDAVYSEAEKLSLSPLHLLSYINLLLSQQ